MAKAMENAPSVEKIFAAVTTEVKPNTTGKYFVQIDDNWRMQSIRESFVTLEDAVKISRIMHSELCKVSRLIYATIEACTVDISEYCFRSDDWTTLFEIDNYGNEKIKHRDTIKVVAEIENRTVEEVTGDIGRTTEDYGIYHSTAKVEEVDTDNATKVTKFEVGKWYCDCCVDSDKSPAYKVTHRTKKMVTLTNDFGEVIKRRIDVTRSVEEVSVSGEIMPVFLKATCFCTNADEIQKAEDDLAYSLAQDTEVAASDSVAEVEEVKAELDSINMALKVQQIGAYIRSDSNRIKNLNVAIDGFKTDLEYHAEHFEKMLEENDEYGMLSTARTIKNQLNHIAELEKEIADLEKRIKALKAERVQYTDKKAKVEEVIEETSEVAADAEIQEVNTAERKTYFIEVYTNEFGNSDNDAEVAAQYEYPSLLAAYDAAADVKEEFKDADFYKLEIVDSEDLNRVYYELGIFGGKIIEPELQELVNNRKLHSAEMQATRAQIDCLDDYVVKLDYDETAEIEETNVQTVEKEPTLIDKLRAKVAEQKNNPRKPIIDWQATFADMELEKEIDEERKKLGSILAELKGVQQTLKDAIKTAVGNDKVYWKYAEKAKNQVSGWLKMYRDCLKNIASYKAQFAA